MRPRPPTSIAPTARLARAVVRLPARAVGALEEVASREDVPLVAGSWQDGPAGCLVANVLAVTASEEDERTLDLRILEAVPELSSRDLNRLVVAWDEAAAEARAETDAELRTLLRDALAIAARAGAHV